MQKVCKGCGKLLDISYFTKDKTHKDGYENKCKKCRLEQRKKYINICIICGKKFKTIRKETKYCSSKCSSKSQERKLIVKCYVCGKEKQIIPSQLDGQERFFCSKECNKKWRSEYYKNENNPGYKPKIKCTCDNCGKEFYKTKSKFERCEKHYCSVECQHIGNAFILENNRKLRENKIKVNCSYCGKKIEIVPSELKYKKHIYCSKKCQHKGWGKYYSGINSPQWNFNLSLKERIIGRKYPEYYEWRIKIYEKDNYTCQCCGDNKGHNLRAHHILNYSEHKDIRLDIKNGITLCNICHKNFHDTYGYTHNTKEQLEEFLKNKNLSSKKYAI